MSNSKTGEGVKELYEKREIKELKKFADASSMTDEEKERVGRILADQKKMLDCRAPQHARWDDEIKRQQFSKVELEGAEKTQRSNVRIPREFSFVESKTADEMESLPFSKVLATSTSNNALAQDFQKIFDYVKYEVINFKELMYRLHMQQKNPHGDAFVKVFWYQEYRNQRKIVKKKNGKEEEVLSRKLVFDDIRAELLDVRDILIDPIVFQSGKTIEDANKCQIISFVSAEEFEIQYCQSEKDSISYKNTEMVVPTNPIYDKSIPSQAELEGAVHANLVEICESWDLLDDRLTILANGIEILTMPCPYIDPFNGAKTLPIAHFVGHMMGTGFYNRGIIALVAELASETETMRNINYDAAKAYTHPAIFYGGDNDIDTDEMVWGIKSAFEVEDVNQIKQLNQSANSGLPFNLEGVNGEDQVTITGHNIRAVTGSSGATATEILRVKESQNIRTRSTTAYNEVYGYKRFDYLVKNLIIQNYGVPGSEKVINHALTDGTVNYFDFKGKDKNILRDGKNLRDYKITVVANNQLPASRELQKSRDMEALTTLIQIPRDQKGQIPPDLIGPVRKVMLNMEIPEDELPDSLKKQAINAPVPSNDPEDPMEVAKKLGLLPGKPEQGGPFKGRPGVEDASGGSPQQEIQSIIQKVTK